ncbi:MAG: hypothetical protein AMJ46_14415 [Latescibacteria bacterium DG_63]|nr:MAG: hypothetical protein AMJ46_14415 [Latescibacteria bacterium DG_63]
MKKVRIVVLVLLCAVMVGRGDSWARSIQVDAVEAVSIKPAKGSDRLRFLMRFTLPDSLQGHSIDFACVSFGASCSGKEGGVSFQAFALSTDWEAETVSWYNPWERPGGDWDESSSSYWISENGADAKLCFDVTWFANAWLKEPSKNFGVLVKVSGPFLGSFSVSGTEGIPKLNILY